jgi:hypothetical protein
VGIVRRRSENLVGLVLHGGTKLEVDGYSIAVQSPRRVGKIESVDDEAGTFHVVPTLPVAAIGSAIRINNPKYSHGSLYRVGDIGTDGAVKVDNSELTLGRSRVDAVKDETITSTAPLVFGFLYDRSTRFLIGKRIVINDENGTIAEQTGFKKVKVTGVKPKEGDEFVVYDVQVGDTVEFDAAASLVEERNEWVLTANTTVDVHFPFAVERAAGDAWTAVGDHATVESLDLSTGPVRFRRAK